MRKLSAGLLLYEIDGGVLRVLIAHMGGPFWATKDLRAWSVPKGEYADGDDPQEVARREFEEELGAPPPAGAWLPLGSVQQAGGKRITGYALRGRFDTAGVTSNEFQMEWPKGSGRMQSFPEIDRAEWFDVSTAREKLVRGQVEFLDRLLARLRADGEAVSEGRDVAGEP